MEEIRKLTPENAVSTLFNYVFENPEKYADKISLFDTSNWKENIDIVHFNEWLKGGTWYAGFFIPNRP